MTTAMDRTDVRGHGCNERRCRKEERRQNTSYSGLLSCVGCLCFDFFRGFCSLGLNVSNRLFRFFHSGLSFGA